MPNVCDYGENIVGPFKQTLFLGCSVKSFTCTVGWNEQQTNLTVELTEDPCPGDKIYYDYPGHQATWTQADPGFEKYRPAVGAPVYFRVADFEFAGIVQSWNKRDDTSGLNQYTVNISDPRFILQNTQLILNENNGSVGGLYNVLNVFGYLEGHGFGKSDFNDQGVPWSLVKLATGTMLSGEKDPSFGPHGAIAFRAHDWNGVNIVGAKFGLIKSSTDSYDGTLKTSFGGNGWFTGYFLDLHDIPFAPSIYRLGADSMTVMDLISQVCADAGCDYYIEMFITQQKQKIIKVRTQQRREQPTMGRIQEFLDTRDNVISKNVGRELRNEPTSSLATGANYQTFFSTTSIVPWWGLDEDGNAITYTTTNTNVPAEYGSIFNVRMDFRKLNTTLSVPLSADFVYVDEIEMRAALKGIDDWKAYCTSFNGYNGTTTGQWLYTRGYNNPFKDAAVAAAADVEADAVNNGLGNMPGGGGFDFNPPGNPNLLQSDINKVHTFIQSFANEYYGKKVLIETDAETYYNTEAKKNYYSALPAGEAWIEDGSTWLGLTKPSVYMDPFTSDTAMISGGARFSATTGFVQGGEVISDGTYLYVRANADSNFVTGVKTVVTLASAVEAKTQEAGTGDDYAGTIFVGRAAGRLLADLQAKVKGFDFNGSDVAFGLSKKRYYPTNIEVPMRSNYTKYGPFAFQGPPGPVNMKPNDDLSPWNYGGSSAMTTVANSQSQDGLTFMQVGERGSVNWPGYPEHRIGSELRSTNTTFNNFSLTQYTWTLGLTSHFYYYIPMTSSTGSFGPNITSVAVNIGEGGINTTYELTTFTPNFGRLSKLNTERIKQAAKNRVAQAKQRRKMAFMDMYVQRSRFMNNRGS